MTLTRLNDGTVLAAGGFASSANQPTVERYNPSTNAFTVVSSMTRGRSAHTATLLQDGRVLVAGGFTGPAATQTVTATAELYNPATGLWMSAASMAVGHAMHTANLLPD